MEVEIGMRIIIIKMSGNEFISSDARGKSIGYKKELIQKQSKKALDKFEMERKRRKKILNEKQERNK